MSAIEEKPILYSKNCDFQKQNIDRVLEEHSKLMKFQDDDVIMDVGCAEGSVTFDTLLPKIKKFGKVVLLDSSEEMLDLAKSKCNIDNCEFVQLDITGKLTEDLKGKFDHIFSFHCLQLVEMEKQQQVMHNLYKLLKPGGDVFVVLVASTPFFNVWKNMLKVEKWSNFPFVVPPYHNLKNPAETFKEYLQNAGFQIKICKTEKISYTFSSYSKFVRFALSVLPYVNYIEASDHEEFVARFEEELKSQKFLNIYRCPNGNVKVDHHLKLLVAHASKLM